MTRPEQQASIGSTLLAETVDSVHIGRTLLYDGGAVLAARLLHSGQRTVRLAATSVVMLDHARESVKYPGLHVAYEHALSTDAAKQFELAVIDVPQSRVLARRWLIEAHAGLREGGVLYLGGANDLGVRPLIEDAMALFGGATIVAAKRRGRVARAVKHGAIAVPAWAQTPGIALGSWVPVRTMLAGAEREIASLPGVFSYDHVDEATALLLEHLGETKAKRVLDLGCGFGVLGLAAALFGATQVDMLDENVYAVAAARANQEALGLHTVRVECADVRAEAFRGPYDLVLTNPPFHTGKQIDYSVVERFIAYARELAAPNGSFLLVANSFLRYDQLLGKHFARVERRASTSRFIVWQAHVS